MLPCEEKTGKDFPSFEAFPFPHSFPFPQQAKFPIMSPLRPLLPLFLAVLPLATQAQTPTEVLGRWRLSADSAVSAGNRAYVQSDPVALSRATIRLQELLHAARPEGGITRADSMVYTADLLKLRADSLYERFSADPADTLAADRAEKLFRKALKAYVDFPPLNQAHTSTVLHEELAQLHYLRGRHAEALKEMDLVVEDFEARIDRGEIEADDPLGPEPYDEYLRQLSARAMCRARVGRYEEALTDLEKAINELSASDSPVYAELLRRRAKVKMLAAGPHPQKHQTAEALDDYRRSFAILRQWATAELLRPTSDADRRESFWLHARPLLADAYRTEGADPGFLFDLTLYVKGLLLEIATTPDSVHFHPVTWTDVQKQLHAGEVAIEFVDYEAQGEERMAALVLHPSGHPQWVGMPRPTEVVGHSFEGYDDCVLQRISSTSRQGKDGLYSDAALRRMVWPEALRRAIGDARTVLFAPDGFQHRLAIEYLWPESKDAPTAASHAPALYRLTSTRRLLSRSKVQEEKGGRGSKGRTSKGLRADSAFVCGAIDFDASQAQTAAPNDGLAYGFYNTAQVRFPFLVHSGAEIDSIRAARQCPTDTLLRGSAATETAFRQLAPHYQVVFLSTHGDFNAAALPQGTDLKPCLTDHTMSENVVALAGVNPSLAASAFDAGNSTDGLLSALELSDLPLQGVRLFAISACQTALGFISSEGVYGLQRGLKLAGAQTLMLSLWSVHDQATSELMTHFHRALASGLSAHDALWRARAIMKGQMRADGTPIRENDEDFDEFLVYDTPQYTNAFILIDALP